MLLWRICREIHADLSGAGARLHGGRWNLPGKPALYAAESAALALLEIRVHLDLPLDLLPDDYVLLTIDADEVPVEDVSELPDDPALFGTEWLASGRSVGLSVPSFIIPEGRNMLLNPVAPGSRGSLLPECDRSASIRVCGDPERVRG